MTPRASLQQPAHLPRGTWHQVIVLQTIVLTGVLILLVVLQQQLTERSLRTVANGASLGVLAVILLVSYLRPTHLWSASSVYIIVFSLFHFGLTAVWGLGLPIASVTLSYMGEWFFTPDTVDAIVLACIGLLSCAVGSHIALIGASRGNRRIPDDTRRYAYFTLVGLGLLSISVCAWFLIFLRTGGTALLVGSYEAALAVTDDNTLLPLTYYGINFGIAFLASAAPSRARRIGAAIFVAWTLAALPLGFRGEVLFPALTALVIAAKRNVLVSTPKALLIALALLSLIGVIREVRQVGVHDLALLDVQSTPLDALTELGSSLRPVTEVVYWHATGDDFIYGSSYLTPFDRVLTKLYPDWNWKQPAGEDDDRLMNQLAIRRVGAIGFSPVAEAYRNFGTLGVCGFMGFVGFLLGRLDQWPATQVRQVALGIVLLPLLVEVRNDFIAVPFQIIMGFTVLSVTWLVAQRQGDDDYGS